MQVLKNNVLILKQKPQYQGLIQGVGSDENVPGKVMGVGNKVEDITQGNLVLLNWKMATNIKNDLWVIDAEHIVAILDDQEV